MAAPRVLIIESDESTLGPLRTGFERAGASILIARDGERGLAMAESERPDLIVLCAELPGISGYSVCKNLKRGQTTRGIPVLLTSAAASEGIFQQHRRMQTRAEEYYLKPLDASAVVKDAAKYVSLSTASSPGGSASASSLGEDLFNDADELFTDEELFASGDFAIAIEPGAEVRTESENASTVVAGMNTGEVRGTDPVPVARSTSPTIMAEGDHRVTATTRENPAATESARSPDSQGQAERRPSMIDASTVADLASAEARAAQASRDADAAKAELEIANSRIAAMEAAKAGVAEAAEERAQQTQTRIAELESRIQAALARAEEAERKAVAKSEGGTSSARELLTLREALNQKEREVLEFKDEIFKRDHAVLEARETATAMERERDGILTERDAANAALGAAEQERDAALEAAGTAEEERETAVTQLSETRAELETATAKITQLETELSTTSSALAKANEQRAELEVAQQVAEEAHADALSNEKETVSRLSEEIAETRSSLATARERVAELEANAAANEEAAKTRTAELEADLQAVDEALQAAKSAEAETRTALTEATARAEMAEGDLATARAEKASADETNAAQLATLKSEHAETLASLETKAAEDAAEMERVHTEALQEALSGAQAEAEREANILRQSLATAEQRADELEADLAAKTKAFNAEREALELREAQLVEALEQAAATVANLHEQHRAKLSSAERAIKALGDDLTRFSSYRRELDDLLRQRSDRLGAVVEALGLEKPDLSSPGAPEPKAADALLAFNALAAPTAPQITVPEPFPRDQTNDASAAPPTPQRTPASASESRSVSISVSTSSEEAVDDEEVVDLYAADRVDDNVVELQPSDTSDGVVDLSAPISRSGSTSVDDELALSSDTIALEPEPAEDAVTEATPPPSPTPQRTANANITREVPSVSTDAEMIALDESIMVETPDDLIDLDAASIEVDRIEEDDFI